MIARWKETSFWRMLLRSYSLMGNCFDRVSHAYSILKKCNLYRLSLYSSQGQNTLRIFEYILNFYFLDHLESSTMFFPNNNLFGFRSSRSTDDKLLNLIILGQTVLWYYLVYLESSSVILNYSNK